MRRIYVLMTIFYLSSVALLTAAEVPREAFEAWRKAEDYRQRCSVTIDVRGNTESDGGPKSSADTHHVKIRGEWVSFIQFNTGTSSAKGEVINSKYAFSIKKKQTDWRLAGLLPGPSPDLENTRIQLRQSAVGSLNPHFRIREYELSRFFASKGVKVRTADSVGDYFNVTFEVDGSEKSFGNIRSGKMQLDPKNYWCIKDAEFVELYAIDKFHGPMNWNWKITYKTNSDFPEVAEFVSIQKGFGLVATAVRKYHFDSHEPSETDFRLTQFGLPEPRGVDPPEFESPMTNKWVIFGIILAVCIIAMFAFRRLGRHSNAK